MNALPTHWVAFDCLPNIILCYDAFSLALLPGARFYGSFSWDGRRKSESERARAAADIVAVTAEASQTEYERAERKGDGVHTYKAK